jgi:hypothetical protein
MRKKVSIRIDDIGRESYERGSCAQKLTILDKSLAFFSFEPDTVMVVEYLAHLHVARNLSSKC